MVNFSFMGSRCVLVVLLALIATPAWSQPSDTCDGSQSLDGMDALPVVLNLGAGSMTDTFTMTGAGCTEVAGDDMVVCMTPENSCNVDVSCFYTPAGGGNTSANVFQGSCTTTPASCLDSSSGAGTQTLSNIALSAGTEYCMVCSNNVGATSLDVSITAASGDCGALPVSLQSFSVGSAR